MFLKGNSDQGRFPEGDGLQAIRNTSKSLRLLAAEEPRRDLIRVFLTSDHRVSAATAISPPR